ncbi:9464_t:CDS:2, partial [Entrophospora sp. SA101]
SHTANGERRNDKDDDKTRLSLIPDSKLINKKMNKEILVIEKAKKTYVEDRRKFKTDKTKLGILLHDQITSIYKELSQEEKGDNIDKLKSFGIQTSATIQGIGNLSGLLLLLIQLRSIIFQNCNIMNGIFGNLSNDDDRSTPPLQKKWLVEIERIEIDCNYDDIITLGIDTQILINWPKPKIAVLPNSLALSVIKFEAMGYRYIKNNNNNSYADEEINNIYNSIKAVNNNLTKHELLIDNKILSTNEQ